MQELWRGSGKGVGDVEGTVGVEEEEQEAWGMVKLARCWEGWMGVFLVSSSPEVEWLHGSPSPWGDSTTEGWLSPKTELIPLSPDVQTHKSVSKGRTCFMVLFLFTHLLSIW